MAKGGFREFKVWQKGKDLAVYIYKITNEGLFAKSTLTKQLIRR